MENARFVFRAQTRKYGEKVKLNGDPLPSNWVYGACNKSTGKFSIIYLDTGENFPVYTETIGQCTGITDKNARYIYEGDIVRHSDHLYEVKYADSWWGFQFVSLDGKEKVTFGINGTSCLALEVVGNIHDGFELLKN